MLARAAFYPTLLYNVLMEKVTSRQWYNRIDNHIVLGALPFKSMISKLKNEEDIKAVVSMNEEYELKYFSPSTEEWNAHGIEQLKFATPDLLDSPSLEQLRVGVSFINSQTASVYVHCKAGRGRIACYLMDKHKWDPQKAFAFIQKRRSHVFLNKKQKQTLDLFYNKLHSNGG